MHILLGILGAAATAIFFIYRLWFAARAAREIADTVGDPRRFVRKFRWARKIRSHPLDTIDDPREAATALMLAVARTETDPGEAAGNVIQAQMRRYFGQSEHAAADMFRQIAWMTRDVVDVGPRMRRLVTLLQQRCTAAELADAAAMLEATAQAAGGLTPARRQIIERFRQILREQDTAARK